MEEAKTIQIVINELKDNIKYNDTVLNIFSHSNIFAGKHDAYRETFTKTSRVKIFAVRLVKVKKYEPVQSFMDDVGRYYFFHDSDISSSIQDFTFNDFSRELTARIELSFFKIFKYLIPFDYSFYMGLNKSDIENNFGKIVKDYINSHEEVFHSDMPEGEIIFECRDEDLSILYSDIWTKIKYAKGFILKKNSLYYLRTFYEENKDETSVRDFLNNTYAIFESLPEHRGIVLFSNKINHVDFFQDLVHLYEINRDLAKYSV
ncbi:hypothetical protein HY745_08655 [Candidatus Desantisbacteria bacterium]|nr:hypothetical protein [Candidatus Desantisbacteria bacterium]